MSKPIILSSNIQILGHSPFVLIYGSIIILLIIYSSEVPNSYRAFADTMLGRILIIAIVYGTVTTMGWVYGILTAMAFLLILRTSSRTILEAFNGGGAITEKKTIGNRWFVEKVLGEWPVTIETDRVATDAIDK
jgi:hypothetical protein